MRIANAGGRLVLTFGGGVVDVERASGGRLPADPASALERFGELGDWVAGARGLEAAVQPVEPAELGPPSPAPRQVFAIGLNYRDHAAEAQLEVPTEPAVFTKFPSCLTGPHGTVELPGERVDWEVELVVVMGRRAEHVEPADAWSYVAGLTLGQDISERRLQFRGKPPQFSLGKSYPGFGPMGPVLVTPDEFANPDDLEIGCCLDGEEVQRARTALMVFSIPELVSYLSGVCPLLPGDVIFTGTPAGVGSTRSPRRYLRPGEEIVSFAEGIGEMRNRCMART